MSERLKLGVAEVLKLEEWVWEGDGLRETVVVRDSDEVRRGLAVEVAVWDGENVGEEVSVGVAGLVSEAVAVRVVVPLGDRELDRVGDRLRVTGTVLLQVGVVENENVGVRARPLLALGITSPANPWPECTNSFGYPPPRPPKKVSPGKSANPSPRQLLGWEGGNLNNKIWRLSFEYLFNRFC